MERKPSPPVTVELAAEIRRLRAVGLYQHQIAAVLGLNQGRISEVLTGKTHPPEPPAEPSLFN